MPKVSLFLNKRLSRKVETWKKVLLGCHGSTEFIQLDPLPAKV